MEQTGLTKFHISMPMSISISPILLDKSFFYTTAHCSPNSGIRICTMSYLIFGTSFLKTPVLCKPLFKLIFFLLLVCVLLLGICHTLAIHKKKASL